MQLIFQNPHLSIDRFDPVDIPEFTILTGVNGSGKSHLLEAIERRHVTISGKENAPIVLFNYETFKLDNEPEFNGHQIAAERESAWQYHEQQIRNNAISWRSGLGAAYDVLKASCAASKRGFLSLDANQLGQYKVNFTNFFNSQHIRTHPQAQGIQSLAKQLPYSIDEVRREEFLQLYKPYVFKNDFLPNQLGKIFWDYYIKYRGNQINEYENAKNGKSYQVLSEDDFIKTHGEKPWELVNKILQTFDTLRYKVNSPEGADYFGNFRLRLQHIEKPGLEVEFGSLSSGEKILMALVASVYKSASDGHFPDILLLDEVDASLHPSMMKNMLDVIQQIFLKQGVKVIFVTHSPTTIALAPEASVYVVNRIGPNRVEKKSKAEALTILTQGFATLEEGLRLFDEVAKSQLTVITEGRNTRLISEALRHHGVQGVEILTGIEGVSGKNQLKTLFDFFSRTNHSNKVVFVWDCDVANQLSPARNTFPYILPRNNDNQVARTGIENMFPVTLFSGFTNKIERSDGMTISEFDSRRKVDFEEFVLGRNNAADFANFIALANEIERIRSQ